MTDIDPPSSSPRTCEWCGSPMATDGRAVCPSCGRLASRLAVMGDPEGDEPGSASTSDAPAAAPAPSPPPPPAGATPSPATPPAPLRPLTPKRPAASPTEPPPPPPAGRGRGGDRPSGLRDEPVGLPPEERRAGWKAVAAAAAVILIVVVGLFVVLGGDDGGGDAAQPSAPTTPRTTLDVSELDDPATTSTEAITSTSGPETTVTTTPAADGRLRVTANGLSWTMQSVPATDDTTWSATTGDTTEVVTIADAGADYDADDAMQQAADTYGGTLAGVRDSKLAGGPGRTASFIGEVEGQRVVGWIVAAEVDGRSVVVMASRPGNDIAGLYPEFLPLPASVQRT